LLFERPEDVNARSGPRNETALSLASITGHLEIMRLLLEHRADPNASDYRPLNSIAWGTPLHRASKRGHAEVAHLLPEYGADANPLGKRSGTPLHRTSEGGRLEVARILLE
ncbi:ankyrin repeat-containing domain protein, partial [Lactifluus subvellereus]